MSSDLITLASHEQDMAPIFSRVLNSVREDLRDDPYIIEAINVLQVGGYRSSIGSFWNAVVDDLRNKVMFRSLKLFNQAIGTEGSKEIKTYEDFQNHVNDDQLIDGAYKIGVIGWEASKILKHAKETRHIFDGHPKSTAPSILKVLTLMDDCIKYVLNEEYPTQIIDVNEYISNLKEESFDRNKIAIESALGDLPEIYKDELANRLYTSYIHKDTTSILRSNIEYISPILWKSLTKKTKIQISRRVDQELTKGNLDITDSAFKFIEIVNSLHYLSAVARRYKVEPLIEELEQSLDDFSRENNLVKSLSPYASLIPNDLSERYVKSLTQTYVGRVGSSARFNRTNFYADIAAQYIPDMFEKFDDSLAEAFVETIRTSDVLKRRIRTPSKLQRLRTLGNITLEKISDSFQDKKLLEILCDEDMEEDFFKAIK